MGINSDISHSIIELYYLLIFDKISENIMYTFKQAVKLVEYYNDKVIGKPLSKKKAESLPISELKIEELKDNSFNVFCYGEGSIGVVFFTTIDKVAQELNLLSPEEILEI